MNKTLKKRTIRGLKWSFIDNFTVQGIHFVTAIVLARLLSPSDFGLIGMITIFISIGQWFIDSGFGQALIRKQDCSQADFSTVFIFNLAAGLILYIVLYLTAPLISRFFDEAELNSLIKVFGLNLIIISLTIIQQTQLTKRLDFKRQTQISLISSIVSGTVGIAMALKGLGVWSLVYKSLIEYSLRSLLLWFLSHWRPSLMFSRVSFNKLFGFGYKLMLRGLIYTVFNNIYYGIIGKYYSTATLGYYTKAEQFSNLFSHNINKVVNRVTYPSLSELQENYIELKKAYQKIFISLVYLTSVSMITLGALAEPVVILLIGEKWRESIILLQLLSIIGLLYPLADFNLTILKIVGNSSLILKLEVAKRLLSIPVIVIGVYTGINYLLFGIIILTIIEVIINGYFSGQCISYGLKEQIRDIAPSIIISLLAGVSTYLFSTYLNVSYLINLLLSLTLAGLMVLFLSEALKNKGYLYLKETFMVRKYL